MSNGAGFYKYDGSNFYYAPNFVLNKNYQLYKDSHSSYSYPIDSWYWFDSLNLAKEFFNLLQDNTNDNIFGFAENNYFSFNGSDTIGFTTINI